MNNNKTKINELSKDNNTCKTLIIILLLILIGFTAYIVYKDKSLMKETTITIEKTNIIGSNLLNQLITIIDAKDTPECYTDTLNYYFTTIANKNSKISNYDIKTKYDIIANYLKTNNLYKDVPIDKCFGSDKVSLSLTCKAVSKQDFDKTYQQFDFKNDIKTFIDKSLKNNIIFKEDTDNYYLSYNQENVCQSSSTHKITSSYGTTINESTPNTKYITLQDVITITSDSKTSRKVISFIFKKDTSNNYKLWKVKQPILSLKKVTSHN